MKKISKRGQEEMVGFVLIVVLVAVIFLVFLGIALRKQGPATEKESKDVSYFLSSTMEYTTECVVSSEPAFLSIGELIKNCYSKSKCISGKSACEVLNKTIGDLIEANWKIGKEKPISGYKFNAKYTKEAFSDDILSLSKGNCSVNIIGAEYFFSAYPGTISCSLKICT